MAMTAQLSTMSRVGSSRARPRSADDDGEREEKDAESWLENMLLTELHRRRLQEDAERRLVFMQVYDASRFRVVEALNLAAVPLGFGGAFHVGISVYGEEFSYGYMSKGTGICRCVPGKDTSHRFRTSVPLDVTKIAQIDVERAVSRLAKSWRGTDYHYMHHNCVHFANELSIVLGTGALPPWVDKMARAVARIIPPAS